MASSALRPLQLVSSPTTSTSSPLQSPRTPAPPSSTRTKAERRMSLQIALPQSSSNLERSSSLRTAPLSRHSSLNRQGSLSIHTTLGSPLSAAAAPLERRPSPSGEDTDTQADLLRFIAAKERKCLELRQQLAQHEADLLALKRKWARIVARQAPEQLEEQQQPPDVLGAVKGGVQSILSYGMEMLAEPVAKQDDAPRLSHEAGDISSTAAIAAATAKLKSERALVRDSISSTSTLYNPESDEASRPPTPPTPPQDDPLPLPKAPQMPGVGLAHIVPALNKKWEELRGAETLAKGHRRASTLLSDVFAALAPPVEEAPRKRRPARFPKTPPMRSAGSGQALAASAQPAPAPAMDSTAAPPKDGAAASASAKEDDDDEQWNW